MGRSFENRKHSIAKTAAMKSKLYSRYGKQLYVVARNGVPDPGANPSLRIMIDKAKREQVPSHVIEKAIEKAKGTGGEDYSENRYEGYGPGGTALIVDCLTDNATRTVTEVRTAFTKCGAKLGATGSVAHMFDHMAVLRFPGDDEDAVLEAMLEADVDVEEVEINDGKATVYAPAAEFDKARQAVQSAFPDADLEVQEITWLAQNNVAISAEEQQTFEKLLGMLNDCDDVQDIFHNAQFQA